jgi:hypothetical protein
MYGDDWDGPEFIWPHYAPDDLDDAARRHIRRQYAACLTMTDRWFGRLLDELERQGCLDDTLVILTTDHGHMLGEHGLLAKNYMHAYDELALIPLLVRLPGGAQGGSVRSQVTQNIDLAPTLLEHFGLGWEDPIHGASWWPVLRDDRAAARDWALYGWFGSAVNVTDGRYTYHRFPEDLAGQEIYQYTLMPTHIWEPFSTEELAGAGLSPPLAFTKGVPVLKVPVTARSPMYANYGPGALLESDTRLYDLAADPGQERPLDDPAVEARMVALMRRLMAADHAPPEAFSRLGLEPAA